MCGSVTADDQNAKDIGTDQGRPTGLARYLPIVSWLPGYQKSWLRGDLIGGLSVWAVAVPMALGYATISGVPVQYGLYAALAGLIAYALFTTSRQVTEGPSSITAPVLGAGVLSVAAAGSHQANHVCERSALPRNRGCVPRGEEGRRDVGPPHPSAMRAIHLSLPAGARSVIVAADVIATADDTPTTTWRELPSDA
jgi:hypothetical protein